MNIFCYNFACQGQRLNGQHAEKMHLKGIWSQQRHRPDWEQGLYCQIHWILWNGSTTTSKVIEISTFHMWLIITTFWANTTDDKLTIFFLYFPENRIWHVKSCFLGKIRKILQYVICWYLSPACSELENYFPMKWPGCKKKCSIYCLSQDSAAILFTQNTEW